jgi:hypothetical protein
MQAVIQSGIGRFTAVSLFFAVVSIAHAGDEPPFEKLPKTLAASSVLPGMTLKGEGYTVSESVSNDGYQNTYTIESDYGTYTVTGNTALAARIQEIKATRALEEIERSDAFKDAVKGTASGMVEGGKSLVTSPVETTKGAAKGVGRWLGNVGKSVTSDDPHQENVLKTALGHDAVKRGYAIELGVDPYTDFEPFQKRLGEVARAATTGGLVMSLGMDIATEGTLVGTVVTVTSIAGMKEILRDEPPSTLSKINRKKLEEMGIGKVSIDALLKNYNYTPAEMTMMVEALRRMGDIKGRDIFVAHATAAPDKVIARYMQQSAEMIANYVTGTGKGDLIDLANDPWLMTRSGILIGAFPIDYFAWTPEASTGAQLASEGLDKQSGAKGKELWIEGQVDPVARKALEARGWKVKENVRLASRTKTGGAIDKPAISPGAVGAGKVAPQP